MTEKRGYKKGLHCPCGSPVTDYTKTGICKPCSIKKLASPEIRERAAASHRKRHRDDPEFHARMAKIAARNVQKASLDPVIKAKWSALGKEAIKRLYTPEARAKWLAGRPAMGKRRHESYFAWCPDLDLREKYRKLVYTPRNGINAATARKIIEAELADREAMRSSDLLSAVDYLRRFAPIKKLEDGRYQHGHAILTAGEVMARAKFRGWVPFNHAKQPANNAEQTVKTQGKLAA